MRLPIEAYKSKSGPLCEAITTAADIVERWGSVKENQPAVAEMVGWVGVDLVERFAVALLRAQGFDLDTLEDIDSCTTLQDSADRVATWERAEIARLGWKPSGIMDELRVRPENDHMLADMPAGPDF